MTTSYDPVYINSTDDDQITIYYNIIGLHPPLNYIFTASLDNLVNSTRNKDHVIFCKSIVEMFYWLLYTLCSNLSCSRTHSTVLL